MFLQPVAQPLSWHPSGTNRSSPGWATDTPGWVVTRLITWVATNPQFNDKTVYTTLGRTLGPFNKMGTFLVEVFEQYNWRKVVFLSSNYFVWLEASVAIRQVRQFDLVCVFSYFYTDVRILKTFSSND